MHRTGGSYCVNDKIGRFFLNACTPIQKQVIHELLLASKNDLTVEDSIIVSANAKASLSQCLTACIYEGCRFVETTYGHIFIVSRYQLDPIENVQRLLLNLSNDAYFRSSFKHNKNLVIVELGEQEVEFCSSEMRGVRHIYIHAGSHLENSITHELTHAFCCSGNRFLDEGLAMYMEKEVAGNLNDYEALRGLTMPSRHLEDYRHLIVEHAHAGCFLSSEEKYSPLYIQAMHAVMCVSAHVPENKLFALFETLANCRSGLEHFQVLQQHLDLESGTGAVPAMANPAAATSLTNQFPSARQVTEAVIQAGLTRTLSKQYCAWLEMFRRQDVCKLSDQNSLLYLKLLVEELWYKNSINCSSLQGYIDNVRFLSGELRQRLEETASYHVLLAQLEALELSLTGSPLEMSQRFTRYKNLVARAEEIDGELPEVIFESSKVSLFESRLSSKPEQHIEKFNHNLTRLVGSPYEKLAAAL